MPAESYIPKDATQQSDFLKKYPEYDGRGIKIAVIDSDIVDISLPGMQITTTGLPKISYCLGKEKITVDTSKVVDSNGKQFITGLTGRKLKIPSKWKNPSNKWHLGVKEFDQLFEFTVRKKDYNGVKALKKELLKEMNKNGLVSLRDKMLECIVWYDGQKWRACINSLFTSNLDDLKVLTDYHDEHEFGYFTNGTPFCVTVSNDGNSLQIICPNHYHATAVTHVVAGHYPDKPESSGLAPGAQIVSMHWINIQEAKWESIL